MSAEVEQARITGVTLARERSVWGAVRPPWYPAPSTPPANPEIYASVVEAFDGFDPRNVPPAPSADEMIAASYMAYDRRHARHRRRDEHGRFLPAPDLDDLDRIEQLDESEPLAP